jgi:hypothetical protein
MAEVDVLEYGLHQTKRAWLDAVGAGMKQQRRPYEPVWSDEAQFMLPYRTRFTLAEQNQGIRVNEDIIDSTVTYAQKTFKGGMLAVNCNPSSLWFNLRTPDPERSKYGKHARWLEEVRGRILRRLAASPFYSVTADVIGDAGGFSNGMCVIEEDYETTFTMKSLPLGSYWIGKDRRGGVAYFLSERRVTLYQAVEDYAIVRADGTLDFSMFSKSLQRQIRENKLNETWVDVAQMIYPNPRWRPGNPFRKRYTSCHYELGSSVSDGQQGGWHGEDENKSLRESGFSILPVKMFQWAPRDGDVWSIDCPGMDTLGDVKQLHLGERRELQAVEKTINPPLVGPAEIATMRLKLGPGEVNAVEEGQSKGLRSIYDMRFPIGDHQFKQNEVRGRVLKNWHTPLFRLFEGLDENKQRTATEIEARKAEKLVLLSPHSQHLQQNYLGPSVESVFDFMVRQDDIPPPPPDLEGEPLEIEYESPMSQAQRAVGLGSITQVVGLVGDLARATENRELLDVIRWEEAIRLFGKGAGAPETMFTDPEELQALRQARAQQAAAAQQMEVIEQGARAAKDLAAAKTGEKNALTDLVRGEVA